MDYLSPRCYTADLVSQVWYESKDGTKVPMFIVRHKTTNFDGTAPAIQYGQFRLTNLSSSRLTMQNHSYRLWRFQYLHRSILQSVYPHIPTKIWCCPGCP